MSVGDFIAMQDVLNELANDSDSLSPDEAIAALEALRDLQSVVRRTESMVETALKGHLEDGTRELGGRVYALKADGKWRYRHDDIDRAVLAKAKYLSTDHETGEVDYELVPIFVIKLMAGLYRSTSTVPKKYALKAIGVDDTPKVADWEHTGKKIEIIDLNAPEGA